MVNLVCGSILCILFIIQYNTNLKLLGIGSLVSGIGNLIMYFLPRYVSFGVTVAVMGIAIMLISAAISTRRFRN